MSTSPDAATTITTLLLAAAEEQRGLAVAAAAADAADYDARREAGRTGCAAGLAIILPLLADAPMDSASREWLAQILADLAAGTDVEYAAARLGEIGLGAQITDPDMDSGQEHLRHIVHLLPAGAAALARRTAESEAAATAVRERCAAEAATRTSAEAQHAADLGRLAAVLLPADALVGYVAGEVRSLEVIALARTQLDGDLKLIPSEWREAQDPATYSAADRISVRGYLRGQAVLASLVAAATSLGERAGLEAAVERTHYDRWTRRDECCGEQHWTADYAVSFGSVEIKVCNVILD